MHQETHTDVRKRECGEGGCSAPEKPAEIRCPGLVPWETTVRSPPPPRPKVVH